MLIFSIFRHYRLRLMRPHWSFCRQRARVHCAHPWAQPNGRLSPCKSSVLTICPSTRATAMLSVAGTRWRHKSARSRFGRPKGARRGCAREGAHLKSCTIIASPGEKSGLDTGLKLSHTYPHELDTKSPVLQCRTEYDGTTVTKS